jgi:hypothetical protein
MQRLAAAALLTLSTVPGSLLFTQKGMLFKRFNAEGAFW